MAGGSVDHNNCDWCGVNVAITQQRCATCIAKATTRIAAPWYSTAEDTIGKKNPKY